MEYATLYIVLAGAFGLFMAWGIGANDVANAMATSVGSKALTIRKAVVIAAIFEFTGAYLAGGQVTDTIRNGIVDTMHVAGSPELLIFGMLAALLGAGVWLLVASHFGWPVSTSHSIVGGIVGFAAVGVGVEAVKWAQVGSIVASWVVSPLLAGTLSFFIFSSIHRLILDTDDPFTRAKRYVPLYLFLVGFVLSLVTLFKGLKHVGLHLELSTGLAIAAGVGVLMTLVGAVLIRNLRVDPDADRDFHYANVERVFGMLMVITASSMAFAHGSNDVANAVGPLAAVVSIATTGAVGQKALLPSWVLLIGGGGIVLGLMMYGRRVIETVGRGITALTPSRGFSAELSAATTVVIASGTGLPISTTHTLVGAILGVGLARGIAAINLDVVRTIVISWVVTLPAGAVLAVLFFYLFRGLFG